MPLNLAELNRNYIISKVCGREDVRHHLESLGFTAGTAVQLLSKLNGYYMVILKDSRIGLDKDLAKRIIVVDDSRQRD